MTSAKKRISENNNKQSEKKIPKRITPTYLHNSGLYYLQRYAASNNHFKEVMSRKAKRSCHVHLDQDYEACLKMIDDLVEKFEASGLLNDKAFAHGLATSYRRCGLSYKMSYQKMRAKGLDGDHIEQALKEIDSQDNTGSLSIDPETRAALTFAKKKRLGIFHQGEESKRLDYNKSLARFARAGFSFEMAKKILEMENEDSLE